MWYWIFYSFSLDFSAKGHMYLLLAAHLTPTHFYRTRGVSRYLRKHINSLIKTFFLSIFKPVMFTCFLIFLILTEKVNPMSIFKIQLLFPAQRLGNLNLVCTPQHTRTEVYSPEVQDGVYNKRSNI